MKIPSFPSVEEQVANIGRHEWSVARLIELSRFLPVQKIPLDALDVWKKYDVTMREMVMHVKTIMGADLSFPIILDEDGSLMDGRHRIMKAMLQDKKEILAVRFDINPRPCRILEG